jgi:hypothetical protein
MLAIIAVAPPRPPCPEGVHVGGEEEGRRLRTGLMCCARIVSYSLILSLSLSHPLALSREPRPVRIRVWLNHRK